MRKYLLALAACLGLTVVPLAPAFAQECMPVEMAIGNITVHPMTAEVHIASPAEAKLAVEIINAMPPETDLSFDTVILATATNGHGLVLVGNGGICQQIAFPPREWSAFLRSVRGLGA